MAWIEIANHSLGIGFDMGCARFACIEIHLRGGDALLARHVAKPGVRRHYGCRRPVTEGIAAAIARLAQNRDARRGKGRQGGRLMCMAILPIDDASHQVATGMPVSLFRST